MLYVKNIGGFYIKNNGGNEQIKYEPMTLLK